MAYARRRTTRRKSYSTSSRRSTYRRAPARRRVSARRVRRSSPRRSGSRDVRVVIQMAPAPVGANPTTLDTLGIQAKEVKPKKARIGSGS